MMNTRAILQMLAVLGCAGLVLELADRHPWSCAIAAAIAAVTWISIRGR